MSDPKIGFAPGATVDDAGVSFCVWAPQAAQVSVVFDGTADHSLELVKNPQGYFQGRSADARHGSTYRYAIDANGAYPDPYSRYQPAGPHGPSMVIDPRRYQWRDASWQGLDPAQQIIYELHIGTFTPEGSYRSAARELQQVKDLGITAIEMLPVNEFVGEFGWGYDGVNWFAPYHPYGTPDDLRALVDDAHALGLGVILDVVYNHFGHDGDYLPQFAQAYLDHETPNPWGGAPNFDCEAMRQFVIDNAAYWIREFHMDGLRLDATQNIHDPRHPHLIAELARAAREAAAPRTIVISAEDLLQRAPLLASEQAGGPALDHLWNDDFHHAARVALTGNHEGYLSDYRGRAQELLSALRNGYLFQGQYSGLARGHRGTPVTHEPLTAFVVFTQNHDQVANTLYGRRLHRLTSPGKRRAMTAAQLLGPCTPLIFMGEEFDASSPFAYFADYPGAYGAQLWSARRKELTPFAHYADPAAQARVLDPSSRETVKRSTLDLTERETHEPILRMYQDLIRLRRTDPILSRRPLYRIDGATLTEHAFLLRWVTAEGTDRLLIVNLGDQIDRRGIPEPLLAAPMGRSWRLMSSSNDPKYGGLGTIFPLHDEGWQLDAECCVFFGAD